MEIVRPGAPQHWGSYDAVSHDYESRSSVGALRAPSTRDAQAYDIIRQPLTETTTTVVDSGRTIDYSGGGGGTKSYSTPGTYQAPTTPEPETTTTALVTTRSPLPYDGGGLSRRERQALIDQQLAAEAAAQQALLEQQALEQQALEQQQYQDSYQDPLIGGGGGQAQEDFNISPCGSGMVYDVVSGGCVPLPQDLPVVTPELCVAQGRTYDSATQTCGGPAWTGPPQPSQPPVQQEKKTPSWMMPVGIAVGVLAVGGVVVYLSQKKRGR